MKRSDVKIKICLDNDMYGALKSIQAEYEISDSSITTVDKALWKLLSETLQDIQVR